VFKAQHPFFVKGVMSALLAAIVVSAGLFAAPASSAAQTPPADQNQLQQPMKFTRVRSDDPTCQPNCPEWIVAQGKIDIGAAKAFAHVIASLEDRRLPILINSPGGVVDEALAMGRLIRSKRLAVAVARTVLTPCAPSETTCDQHTGKAIASGAICVSACPLILAAGVERYASPWSFIAVHQVLSMQNRQQVIVQGYKVEYVPVDGAGLADQKIGAYLEDMGVGSPVMEEILATPNKEVHRLSWEDLSNSNLVTMSIDRMSAMVGGSDANGLAGEPIKPTPGHSALFTAKGSWPLAKAVNGKAVSLQASFAYRRGGGVIEATLSTHDSVTGGDAALHGQEFTIKLSANDGDYRFLKPVDDPQTIPLTQFCKLSSQGRLTIEPVEGPATNGAVSGGIASSHEPGIVTDVAAVDGMNALFGEACSPLSLIVAKETKEFAPREKVRRALLISQ
jgi:hypothetical protein